MKIEIVLAIHRQLILSFGGSDGVRDANLLNSAINRPYLTFDKVELYPNIEDKAAAILESIVKNHPFLDGNKRTGYVLMRYLLMQNGKDIQASEDEKYQLVIDIAEGNFSIEQIKNWIKQRLVKR